MRCVSSFEVASRNKARIDRTVFSSCGQRGVSAVCFCAGAKTVGSHRGHREHGGEILGNANF